MFLSVNTLPIARVPLEDRYTVVKVRSIEGQNQHLSLGNPPPYHTLQGFYGVTYNVGFRDGFDVKVCSNIARTGVRILTIMIDQRPN